MFRAKSPDSLRTVYLLVNHLGVIIKVGPRNRNTVGTDQQPSVTLDQTLMDNHGSHGSVLTDMSVSRCLFLVSWLLGVTQSTQTAWFSSRKKSNVM